MKSLIVLSFSLLLYSCQTGNDYKNDTIDSTQSVVPLNSIKPESTNTWVLDSFINEFGEKGNEKYIQIEATGNFSNSATSGAYLKVEILLTKTAAGIFLHEYRDNTPSQKFIGSGKIRLKNEAGVDVTVYSYSSWNQKEGLLIEGDEYNKLKKFLLNSKGIIKAVIYDDYSSVYSFSFESTGFSELYNKISEKRK